MKFADNMKQFTEDVRRTTQARHATLAAVKEQTVQFLADTRSLLGEIGQENRNRALDLHKRLEASMRERQEEVRQMRQGFAEQLGEMRKELQKVLGETHKQRHEAVHGLLGAARSARMDLAGDLREASRLWQEHGKS